jgi:hypothetical protein
VFGVVFIIFQATVVRRCKQSILDDGCMTHLIHSVMSSECPMPIYDFVFSVIRQRPVWCSSYSASSVSGLLISSHRVVLVQ